MTITDLTIYMFVSQIIFIGFRTINVRAIAKGDITKALFSGALVHWSWLVSIAIGATSMYELMNTWNWSYLPIIVASTTGGLLGTYYGMKNKPVKLDNNKK